jgi:hypothetical protein
VAAEPPRVETASTVTDGRLMRCCTDVPLPAHITGVLCAFSSFGSRPRHDASWILRQRESATSRGDRVGDAPQAHDGRAARSTLGRGTYLRLGFGIFGSLAGLAGILALPVAAVRWATTRERASATDDIGTE